MECYRIPMCQCLSFGRCPQIRQPAQSFDREIRYTETRRLFMRVGNTCVRYNRIYFQNL